MNEEEYLKIFRENEQEYFERNFASKTFYEAIYDSSREAVIKLLQANISFIFLKDSLNILIKDEEFYKTLKKEDKKMLNDMVESAEYIISRIEEIIMPIIEALNGN